MMDEDNNLSTNDKLIVPGSSAMDQVAVPTEQVIWACVHELLRIGKVMMQGSLRSHSDLQDLTFVHAPPPLTHDDMTTAALKDQ